MDLRAAYKMVSELQREIKASLWPEIVRVMNEAPRVPMPDYRKEKALAACYELQEYLANRIAAAVAAGELEPDYED